MLIVQNDEFHDIIFIYMKIIHFSLIHSLSFFLLLPSLLAFFLYLIEAPVIWPLVDTLVPSFFHGSHHMFQPL